MPCAPGTRLGSYEIRALLGAGGMGEVYLARDTRIDRDVALKVLPEALSTDPDRRRRFNEEARGAGALNHPSIVAVFDVSLDGQVPFIVTELVEGSTLQRDIERGPLPVRRALELASQIAAGLSAAHDLGLAHRDLKPANIMVTRDGRAKILDFGLAKVLGAAPGVGSPATQTGVVLGTVPYMSPEQARGAVVDFRSDQFSLGILLYEMLTGVHPFKRESDAQTLSAIIESEPRPLPERKPDIPSPLVWIVERCLAKDPGERYAATSDVARDLATLRARFAEAEGELVTRPRRGRRHARLALDLMLGAATVIAIAVILRAAVPPDAVRLTPLVVDAGYQGGPAWSPDGRSIAYVGQVDGITQVFTRLVGTLLPAQITRSLFDCYDPFWSADGRRIYYHSQMEARQGLWSVSAASGGEPEPVLANVAHATLSPDGRSLVFFRDSSEQGGQLTLWTSSSDGRNLRQIALPGRAERGATAGWIRFSPDGSKILVWNYGFLRNERGSVVTSLFYLIPWPDGTPAPVLQAVSAQARNELMAFEFLRDSRHIVLSMPDSGSFDRHLWIADTAGDRLERVMTSTMSESSLSVSPDGRLAFTSDAVDFDLLAMPVDGGALRPLLATTRNELDPAWSPVLAQYVFVTDRGGEKELRIRSADGQFERPLVSGRDFPGGDGADQTRTLGAPAFSPDGSRVAYQRLGDATGYRIWISAAAGGAPDQLAPVALGGMFQDAPTWSPDGRWVALVQGLPGGAWRIVKTRVGTSEPSVVITDQVRPLSRPAWSPDGRQILFESMDGLAVVSPEGGAFRVITEDTWLALAWSADSRVVYGIREADPPVRGHLALFAVDVVSGVQRVINPDLGAVPVANQPVRGLTRAADDTLLTSMARASSDIWVLEPLQAPPAGWSRLRTLFLRAGRGSR